MTEAVVILPATPNDAPACATTLNAWIDETPWMLRVRSHGDVERHYREFVFQKRHVIVAAAPQIKGFAPLDMDEGYMTAFCVAATQRSAGIGKRLMDEAKAICGREMKLWTHVANIDAHRFCEREGFAEADRSDGDNEEGLPDILYRWG